MQIGLGVYRMKNILLLANGGRGWIGGLYYVKNILYTFLKQYNKNKDCKIYILVSAENADLFKKYKNNNSVNLIIYKDTLVNKVGRKLTRNIFNAPLDIELLSVCKKYDIDTIYPLSGYPFMGLKDKCVHWIPDFQHAYLPELFSKKELEDRDKMFEYIAKHHKKLILSSNDAFNSYKSLYPQYTDNVFVMPFLSDIEDEIEEINNEFIKEVRDKYELKHKFIFIANQFWVHKNYKVAFEAINYIVNTKRIDISLVCTGNTNDYRNKNHFESLLNYIKDNNLENNINILGFISRKEQLAIMKEADMIVQPSLFEGWGTSVEDAKVLGKKIILSDINVHYEQANENSVIFEKNNYKDLAEKIIENYS